MTELISIAAFSENNVIASENGIPWDIPADYQHYKSTIKDNITISGRKTYETESSNLISEHHITLTRNKDWEVDDPNIHVVHSIDEAHNLATQLADDTQDIYIIGGENVYREFLDKCDKMILSHISGKYEGVRYYPEFNESKWKTIKTKEYSEFTVVWYERD